MQTKLFIVFSLAVLLSSLSIVSAYEVTAWSGRVCSGVELGFLADDNNTPGLSAVEVTINGQCITIDRDLPADCDVYLCADQACNDQGVTVDGPREAGQRVEGQSFSAIQVGCQ
ncbi:hypothetical protein MPTK1_7g18720 [Marchantia polymorpha subsp. ruderalis]|uniref:Expansin-like EG45 domain-containing protein n=2 Tax=Marchantia polymorpha TaxID=3197 RepID=A0AAF6C167_MARPO|nr:hypothetical protein MARPO_0067s0105 [Marchantia polymorpha]BBN18001.1 hypothetical protein Mp_7g18720 [Marchantia polymorpha subsp. ruderalis]|eukprot:PTQ36034.1 hypothetical protein MARPO_0067s0105 [Marchantia polymorpha]